jgi:hypothetical protein
MTTFIVFFVQPDGLYWTPAYFCTRRIYFITMSASYFQELKDTLILFVCLKSLCEHFLSISSIFHFTRLNGREDMKQRNRTLVQVTTAPGSNHLQFREFWSKPTMANESSVTQPSLIHFQIGGSNQDSNI